MISITKNKEPELNRPVFLCDQKIHQKLDEFPLTSLCNKSNFIVFLGRPGSGKSSLLISFLNTKSLFKKCFHYIFVFMPPNSRASLKDNFFDKNLDEDQIYDGLDIDSLQNVYDKIRENSSEGKLSLIIFDDVQKSLKDKNIQKLLLDICANRRHLRTSLWMANQTYNSTPRQIRQVITNLFVFKINKTEMLNIFNEQVEIFKDKFEEVLDKTFNEPHDFLFIDTNSQRLFANWDEINIEEV